VIATHTLERTISAVGVILKCNVVILKGCQPFNPFDMWCLDPINTRRVEKIIFNPTIAPFSYGEDDRDELDYNEWSGFAVTIGMAINDPTHRATRSSPTSATRCAMAMKLCSNTPWVGSPTSSSIRG
jgi:hypothetical protein